MPCAVHLFYLVRVIFLDRERDLQVTDLRLTEMGHCSHLLREQNPGRKGSNNNCVAMILEGCDTGIISQASILLLVRPG